MDLCCFPGYSFSQTDDLMNTMPSNYILMDKA